MRSVVRVENQLIFSYRLHDLRTTNNFSFQKLYEFSGIPASTIRTWERGTAYPSHMFAVERLAFIFRVPVEYLMGEDVTEEELDSWEERVQLYESED